MPRSISEITPRDLQILKLGKEVQKVIKNRKEWLAFIRYCEVYFTK